MKTWSLVLVAALVGPSLAWSADPPASPSVDSNGLKKLLEELGYKPSAIKAPNTSAWQIEVKHPRETRRHLVGLDPAAGTVFIIGGGFASEPDPKKASAAWYRKLLNANHKIAPNYIFINDSDVFGLTTVMGNVNVTSDRLKAKIQQHVSNFDAHLVPLIEELTK